ncbi:MAG TPA: hypothetical protein DEH78_17825 [Solibacterales bacterium]|nr:hypothetical protein [Bryobacterales bacterium]
MPVDWRDYVRRKLPAIGVGPEREGEIVAELAGQFEEAYAEALRAGLGEEAAVARAQAQVRDWVALASELRSAERRAPAPPMAGFAFDLRFALRTLRTNPVFASVAVAMLAFGIGGNTAIFTVVDHIALRGLPYPEAHRLVDIEHRPEQQPEVEAWCSIDNFLDLRRRATAFESIAAVSPVWNVVVEAEGETERLETLFVSAEFFPMLGVKPVAGRLFTADEDNRAQPGRVAILSYGLWQRRFGGSPEAIGKTLRIAGMQIAIAGVLPRDFRWRGEPVEGAATDIQLWAPLAMNQLARSPRTLRFLKVTGRLREGVTAADADRQVRSISESLAAEFSANRDLRFRAVRLEEKVSARLRPAVLLLVAAVGFVLLMVSANVANLLLARSAARQREVAIRSALGASRSQLAGQLLVESAILAVAGGAAGLLLSSWLTRGLVRFLPYDPATLTLSTAPDGRVLLFTLAVTLGTLVLFGFVPALRGSRASEATTLKNEAGSVTGGHGHVRLRKAFVALQVGLSAMLLIGAGLFVRTLDNLRKVDLGFKSENVAMFGLRPATQYDAPRKLQVFRTVLERLAGVPGVKAAGANSSRLLTGGRWDSQITMAGVEVRDGNLPWSFFNAVTPGYFDALGVPVKRGRDFSWRDWGGGRKLCLVNEALVTQYLDGTDPTGRQLAQGRGETPDTEIIGVFSNARYHDLRGEVPRQTFVNLDSRLDRIAAVTVYVRMQGDPRAIMPLLREEVRRTDPDLVVFDLRTLDEQLNQRLANERMLSFLSAGFAVLAALLAVVGLHGVLAFVVTRRTREIGIRIALGAGRRSVIGMVMREMLAVIFAGLAAGAAAAYLGGRFVESQLYGARAMDLVVFGGGLATLLGASLGASLAPAWRASRIAPIRALRHE